MAVEQKIFVPSIQLPHDILLFDHLLKPQQEKDLQTGIDLLAARMRVPLEVLNTNPEIIFGENGRQLLDYDRALQSLNLFGWDNVLHRLADFDAAYSAMDRANYLDRIEFKSLKRLPVTDPRSAVVDIRSIFSSVPHEYYRQAHKGLFPTGMDLPYEQSYQVGKYASGAAIEQIAIDDPNDRVLTQLFTKS